MIFMRASRLGLICFSYSSRFGHNAPRFLCPVYIFESCQPIVRRMPSKRICHVHREMNSKTNATFAGNFDMWESIFCTFCYLPCSLDFSMPFQSCNTAFKAVCLSSLATNGEIIVRNFSNQKLQTFIAVEGI